MIEPEPFQKAYERLLSRAPGPVFPRARALYLRKYCLEGESAAAFRTFLLDEEIHESAAGAVRSRALGFAVVHWQGDQLTTSHYAAYLAERWQLYPADLIPVEGESWFRGSGAWARFSAPAVFERRSPTTLVSPPADPAAPADAAGPSR